MLVLVIGGAGSGKSEFAESIIEKSTMENRVYIATLIVRDSEDRQRADKHIKMRADKRFSTIEAPVSLHNVTVKGDSAVLLEDLSNLTANEFFSKNGRKNTVERIWKGLLTVKEQSDLMVVVSNDIFSDGVIYDVNVSEYMDCLSELNCAVAKEADLVYEVVCGIPVKWKGEN